MNLDTIEAPSGLLTLSNGDWVDPPMLVRSADVGGFIRANDAFCERVGFNEEELAGKPLIEWIQAEDQASFAAALKAGEGCCRVGRQTADGDVLPMEVHVAAKDLLRVLGEAVAT